MDETVPHTIYVEANVLSIYAKFQLLPLMVSVKKFFYQNLPFMSPLEPIKLSDLDKRRVKRGGLLNKHFCEKNQISPMRQQNLSISTFPIISLWEL